MGVGGSQRIPLFWHETHTKSLRVRSPTRPEEDEGRKVPETVGKREQEKEGQSRDESGAERRPVNRSQKGDS